MHHLCAGGIAESVQIPADICRSDPHLLDVLLPTVLQELPDGMTLRLPCVGIADPAVKELPECETSRRPNLLNQVRQRGVTRPAKLSAVMLHWGRRILGVHPPPK